MEEALIIVHLSSIDSYIGFYGIAAGMQFALELKKALLAHPGPIVILDQEWKELSPEARELRAFVLDGTQHHPHATVFHHDPMKDADPWGQRMDFLAQLLRQMGAVRVRLGGLWASQDQRTGCVHETSRQLTRRGFSCEVDAPLCASGNRDARAMHVAWKEALRGN